MKRFRLYLDDEYIGVIFADTIEDEERKFTFFREGSLAAIIWKDSDIIIEEEGVKYNEPNILATPGTIPTDGS